MLPVDCFPFNLPPCRRACMQTNSRHKFTNFRSLFSGKERRGIGTFDDTSGNLCNSFRSFDV